MRTKKEIRDLIGEGELLEAVASAITYAEAAGEKSIADGLLTLQGDLKRQNEVWQTGQLTFEEFNRTQARVTASLLKWVNALPAAPNPVAAKKKVLESNFQWLVFWLFIASKLIVLCWIFWVWWGFTGLKVEEMVTTLGAVLPNLTLYGPTMFRSMLRSNMHDDAPYRFVPKRFRQVTWIVFVAYVCTLILLSILKMWGEFPFETMILFAVGVETGLGAFLKDLTEEVFTDKNK